LSQQEGHSACKIKFSGRAHQTTLPQCFQTSLPHYLQHCSYTSSAIVSRSMVLVHVQRYVLIPQLWKYEQTHTAFPHQSFSAHRICIQVSRRKIDFWVPMPESGKPTPISRTADRSKVEECDSSCDSSYRDVTNHWSDPRSKNISADIHCNSRQQQYQQACRH